MAGRELTTTPTKRDRRKSPALGYGVDSGGGAQQPPPMSPTSSAADTTFEPTIDMMVNDFDDEATLNEEEALADLESHNPADEIATLREESEMPIDQLLAKYSSMTSVELPCTAPRSSSSCVSRRRRAPKRHHTEAEEASTSIEDPPPSDAAESPVLAEDAVLPLADYATFHEPVLPDPEKLASELSPEPTKKPHRSHLLDLYPDESFGSGAQHAAGSMGDLESLTPLQTIFAQAEGVVEEEEEGDSDTDSEDARKIIMVGPNYQAEIPEGLSLYGDILPYENEDQLIWEPSQVSERAVEDYLAKIQETRTLSNPTEEAATGEAVVCLEMEHEELPPVAVAAPPPTAAATVTAGSEQESVVKDNEQALHLLVQCGYDFKEALRRKRLNVPPLSDTMSSWSEEECQKFEEGIQKFGKDFYQIRQNQVRTRTMRELVQFYYLWKKSERRDQSFALNDTIDHMDVFINEAGNGSANLSGNGNGNGNGNGSCSSLASSCSSNNGHSNVNAAQELPLDNDKDKDKDVALAPRKSSTKNYSIMTGGNAAATSSASLPAASLQSQKRGVAFALDDAADTEEQAQPVDSIS